MAQNTIGNTNPSGHLTYNQFNEMYQLMRKRRQEALEVADVVDQNLNPRKVLETAKKQLATQMGLVRFLGLFNLGRAVGESQRLFWGAIKEENRIDIAAAVTHQPSLKGAFDKISAKEFMINIDQINHEVVDAGSGGALGVANSYGNLSKPTIYSIPFVFLGDFLNTILKIPATLGSDAPIEMHDLMREMSGIDLKIMLGYLNYETPFSNNAVEKFPLYYLPISLKKLNNFFTREIIAKDRTYYSIGQLLKDIIHKFIDTYFFACRRDADTGYSPLTPKIDFAFGQQMNPKNPKGSKQDVWFIYDSKGFLNDLKTKDFGKYKLHMAAKIPHFYLGGPDRGIATKIKLRDIADPTLKTAVFYKDSPSDTGGTGGEDPHQGRWAPVVFEAQIDTLGYTNFQLGQLLFVDVRKFIEEKVRKDFLATGYYGIKKIEHKLTPSKFSTTVSAIIQVSEKDKERLSAKADANGAPSGTSGSKTTPTSTTPKTPPATKSTKDGGTAPGTTEGETKEEEGKRLTELAKKTKADTDDSIKGIGDVLKKAASQTGSGEKHGPIIQVST